MMADEQEQERCPSCGKIISDEEYITEYEDRGECHGCPYSEEVVYGYKCECGHEEEY